MLILLFALSRASCQTTEFAIYVPDKYLSNLFSYHVDQILIRNHYESTVKSALFKKSGINYFTFTAYISPKVQDRSQNDSAAQRSINYSNVSLKFELNNSTLKIIDVTPSQDLRNSSLYLTLINKLLNKEYNLGHFEIQDSRYTYVKMDAFVNILDSGIAIISEKFVNYFNANLEIKIRSRLMENSGSAVFIVPIDKINDFWPRSEDTITFTNGKLIVLDRHFSSTTQVPLIADFKRFKYYYRLDERRPFIFGAHEYEGIALINADLKIDTILLQVPNMNDLEIEKLVKFYNDSRSKIRGTSLYLGHKYFFCRFIFPFSTNVIGFNISDKGFIQDKNIFLRMDLK